MGEDVEEQVVCDVEQAEMRFGWWRMGRETDGMMVEVREVCV